MAQELSDKIRAAAQARGIDPEIALRIARAESAVNPAAQAKTSSAGGLFQVVDKTWKEFGGKPGKKYDPDENIRVGTDIIAKNTQTLRSFLNRDPRPAEVYAAHYFGPTGAKSFLSAEPGTPMESIFSKEVIRANPNLKGKTTGQVMASLEKKMGSSPAAPAPTRQANVSRETPPQKFLEPNPLEPLAPAAQAPLAPANKLASLGPGYQAALALSFLADTDEKEERDVEKEPGIAEKWLAESATAPRPAALAEFADISIKSPFAALEPQQPQMLADGGEVEEESAPDVGRPTVSETYMAKTMFPDLPVAEAVYILRGGQRQSTPMGEMLSGNIGAMVPMGKDASAMLMLAGSRPERSMSESKALMAAFNKRVGDEGGLDINVVRPLDAPPGIFAGGMSASYPLGEGRISGNINALKLPGQDPRITGYGVGYGGRVGPGNLSAGIMKQKDGPYSGQIEYRLPIGRADGSPEEGEESGFLSRLFGGGKEDPLKGMKKNAEQIPDYRAMLEYLKSRDAVPEIRAGYLPGPIDAMFSAVNLPFIGAVGKGDIKINREISGPEYEKFLGPSTLAHEMAHATDRQLQEQAGEQSGMFSKGNQFTDAYGKMVGSGGMREGKKRTELARKYYPEFVSGNRDYRATPYEIVAHGVGKYAGPTTADNAPPHVDATAATEFQILLDLARRNSGTPVKRADGSPETGETLTPQQIERIAAQEAMEREAASRPATVNPNIQRQGEAARRLAAMRDVNTLPDPRTYAAVSGFLGQAPDELGFSVMHPDREGIKKAGQAGFGVGTALQVAPVMGALRAAGIGPSSGGKTASAASQLGAIKPRGGHFAVEGKTYGGPREQGQRFAQADPDGGRVEVIQNYVNTYLANTNDQLLNEWMQNKVAPYMRRDMGTEMDQFVRAADEGRKLHFINKPTTEGYTGPHMPAWMKNARMAEGFPEEGFAKTPYGQDVEMITDRVPGPVALDEAYESSIPPGLKQFVKTDPNMRMYELNFHGLDALNLIELRDKMAKMRQMSPEFSKYSQPAVKVPEQYLFTDKSLQGLTPAQASERVAQFDAWKDQTQQKMASRAAFVDPNISRTPSSEGHVWVNPPDLERNPALRELIQDVGCDGGWCTKGENYALSYGSGENRLTVLMDSKARPRAQMTIKSAEPNADDFLLSMDDVEAARFDAAYPDLPLYDAKTIMGTSEYQEWLARNPPTMSITEIKGVNNQADLKNASYLKQIQQRVKDLDAQFGLQSVDNLEGINMFDVDQYLPSLSLLSRSSLGRHLSPEQESQLSAFMRNLNNGSRYVDKNEGKNIFNEADRIVRPSFHPPQQRATGGMIERQSTDNRRYL